MMSKALGDRGELLAAEFMSRHGYEIVERNFRYNRAEIDLIARKDDVIVFCEVKTRKSNTYGTGEEAVDGRKQQQIRKAADGYVTAREIENIEFRFDVIVVDLREKTTSIRHIMDAF